MSIEQDVLSPRPSGYIELFELDLTMFEGITAPYRITPNVGPDSTFVIWGGHEYIPWPVAITGFAVSAQGAPARPNISFGNLDANKILNALTFLHNDIIGGRVRYIRTFEAYLGGSGSLSAAPLTYTIGRKVAHDSKIITFELRNFLDKERTYLPPRQMLRRDFPGLGVNRGIA